MWGHLWIAEHNVKTVDDLKVLQEQKKLTIVYIYEIMISIHHNSIGAQPLQLPQIAKLNIAWVVRIPPEERYQLRC